jgi:8-oxo-dGTP pyrophosphatase MutT (NUDIX family)
MIVMDSPRHREIACAIVIDTSGRFLLQLRDNVVGILHPGMVTLFGGHREGDETFLECVVREIQEEFSYFVAPEQFEYLVTLDGPDLDADGGSFRVEVFITRNIPVGALKITEGSLLVVNPAETTLITHKLTPVARFAMKAFGTPGF